MICPIIRRAISPGVVIDIDLTSAATVQRVRSKLIGEAYQSLPRLFVLADSLHLGPTQAWALGATDTIERPFEPENILHRIRDVFPEIPEGRTHHRRANPEQRRHRRAGRDVKDLPSACLREFR